MPNVLVLQHIGCEHLGSLEALLKERSISFRYCRPFLGEAVPRDLTDSDAIIALGGPMSANDSDQSGFIADELRLLSKGLAAGIPLLGICLGSQLIAKAAGARVYRGSQKEIGWYPLQLTHEGQTDPVIGGLQGSFPVFQWHAETFDLPVGGVCLAASERYPHQAFRLGSNVYALQFHLETTGPMIHEWLELYRDEHRACGESVQHPRTILSATMEYVGQTEERACVVFSRFFSLIV
jgi:GMP synthase (glutamine-hydrolysing)